MGAECREDLHHQVWERLDGGVWSGDHVTGGEVFHVEAAHNHDPSTVQTEAGWWPKDGSNDPDALPPMG
jgi:hypothetical protein